MKNVLIAILVTVLHGEFALCESADLTTPEAAYRTCVAAIKANDASALAPCLNLPSTLTSDQKDSYVQKFLAGWRMSLGQCGFDRKVLGVLTEPVGGLWQGTAPVTPPADTVWIRVEPAGGCQSTLRMRRAGGLWRWDEG